MSSANSIDTNSATPTGVNQETDLLKVVDLRVEFSSKTQTVVANRSVSLSVKQGETLGLVGESGSGKSVLCRAILRLLPSPPAFVRGGQIWFDGSDLLQLPEAEMRQIQGRDISMIFQHPMTSLSPVWSIGDQITEGLRVHQRLSRKAARDRGIELLQQTGIPNPRQRYAEYPHQWSGGMLQRAVIAMAMACSPRLLLADEPTTALDVTIQAQILALLSDLQSQTQMAMLLVSHDIAVIAETCDQIAVMYAGRIVEQGTVQAVFANPRHPYTLGLINSSPKIEAESERLEPIPGQPPDLSKPEQGCPFAARCGFASQECLSTPVLLREVVPQHYSACFFPERIG
jgi:oligopeptide/dipeptide ABC transporter ATP-binding protein